MRGGKSFFRVKEGVREEESVLMDLEWSEMVLGYYKGVFVIFLVATSMLMKSSVFHESTCQELQTFYPKYFFAIAHEHAREN